MGTEQDTAPELTGAAFILDNMDDAVIVTDTLGVVTYWNEGAHQLFGWTNAEMIGRPYQDRFPPEVRPAIARAMVERLAGIKWDGEFEDYRKDGSRVWINARVRSVVDREGKTIGILGISKDISARKQAEAELRSSEAFTRSVLNSMGAHIAVLDRSGQIIAVNHAWRAFSIDNAAVPGTETPRVGKGVNYLDVCRNADGPCRHEAQQVADGIEAVLVGSIPLYEQEYRCDSPTEERWFALTVTPLDIQAGGAVISHFNITERKRIEAEIKEQRDGLQIALATAEMGVWIQSLRTDRVTFSPEVYQIFGLSSFDGTLDSIGKAVHPDDLQTAGDVYLQTRNTGQSFSHELRVYRPDGKLRDISVLGRMHRDDDGTPISLIGTVVDITAKRRRERFLKGQTDILSRIVQGVALQEILLEIAGLIETQIEGGLCSILIKDPARSVLRFAAGPTLPEAYNQAVHEVPIGPMEGSCGTAAYSAAQVWVSDIATDPLWEKYRDVALEHGLTSCLSVPILSQHTAETQAEFPSEVLGTFAIYRTDTTGFDDEVTQAIATASYLAGAALEKARSRRELQESEHRYRQLLELLPVGIAVHSLGKFTFVNKTYLRLAGLPSDTAVVGRPISDFIPPEDMDRVRARVKELTDQAVATTTSEKVLVRPDGVRIPISLVATRVLDRGNVAILVAMLDRSEEQRASELLQAILSSVSDAVITTDDNGTIVMANAATERVLGYAPSELTGQNIQLLIPVAQHASHSAAMNRWREQTGHLHGDNRREMTPQRKDGTTFPAEITVASFQINGKPHFTGVVRDLTARRKLEDQLRQAQKMEAVGQLAGGIAHDFNNLLTVINGQTSRLLHKLPHDDVLHDPLTDILAAGERAATLTAQLLAFSRRAIVEPRLLDLNQVVMGTTRMLRRLIGEDITLLTQLRPGPTTVKMDAGQLEQVLINLALNARDAMPKGGKLTIGTAQQDITAPSSDRDREPAPGSYILLWVADTGIGITDAVKSRIFEPFFTTKGVGKGSGLGLATVYGIVRQAGGYISFESEAGKGTTFRVLLPQQKKLPVSTPAASRLDSPTGTETILLAEDEDVVRKLVRQVLELHGYTVIEASGGQHALEVARDYGKPIDLLLTDVVMPGLGGRELADEVRRHRPDIRVLYMSGYTDDAITRHGVAAAVDAFLQKPFAPPQLLRKIRELLNQKSHSDRS